MAYQNLPGIFENKLDGNLTIVPANNAPIVMVLGTAEQGDSEEVFRVARVSDAASTFGKTGTLVRGLYEASLGGALNLRLFRIGATSAKLVVSGLTIETVAKDDSAGSDYKMTLDSNGRLRIWRTSDDELVYDNNPTYPLEAVDLNEVAVSGTYTSGTVGSGSSDPDDGVDLEDVSGTFTAGTDGLNLSRMEMYEALYNAYDLLQDQVMDVVVPMNVYLDDLNVMDMSGTTITTLGLDALSDYPSAGSSTDVLGKVYVEEYEGENHFWWWFPDTHSSPTFSAANIYPSAGGASATLKTDGTTALTASDFHEVNFAYQLARFCYVQSRDNTEMTGVVGVLPPNSYALKDVAQWVGQLPTTDDSTGEILVSTNGTGLLGNKFMSGRAEAGSGVSLVPAFTIDSNAGWYNGGFIACEDQWLDGLHIKDDNDHLVDLGKYISVVATYPVLANPSRTASYAATGAPTYGGFYSTLPANSAPTNKLLDGVRLPFRVNISKLDLLAGQRYVTFHAKARGVVISDAPTAARPDSDYQRLSTVRQVKVSVDGIRRVSEPFLGEGMTGALLAALETAIDNELKALVKDGVIANFDFQVISTTQQRILGQATVELKLVPAFELRQITVVIGLAAV